MARLHILGAGTPPPTVDRFGTSYVLDVGGGRLAMFVSARRIRRTTSVLE